MVGDQLFFQRGSVMMRINVSRNALGEFREQTSRAGGSLLVQLFCVVSIFIVIIM